MAYTTQGNVEALLGTTFTGSTNPTSAGIAIFIGWADSFINSYTGKSWTSAGCSITDEEYESEPVRNWLSGDSWDGSPVLFLDNYPVTSVEGLYFNGGDDKTPSWTEKTEGTDFTIRKSTGEIAFHDDMPQPIKRAVKVDYTYGQMTVPGQVEELSTVLVGIMALITKGSSANAEDLGSIALGDLHVDYGGTSTSTGSGELISNLGARRDALLSILGKSGTIGV